MLYTVGQCAELFGVKDWQAARVLDRGRVSFVRVGRMRCVREEDLPAVERALLDAGYLGEAVAAGGKS